jgi:hypothetical protein
MIIERKIGYSIENIEQSIFRNSEILLICLFRLFYFRYKKTFFKDSVVSIYNCFHDLPYIKSSKGYFYRMPSEDIYSLLWNSNKDIFDLLHDIKIKEYFDCEKHRSLNDINYIYRKNKNSLFKFIDDYYEWLSKELSSVGKISKSNVQNKIQEILIKYQCNLDKYLKNRGEN